MVFSAEHAEKKVGLEETNRAIRESEVVIGQSLRGAAWNEGWLGWFSVGESAPEGLIARLREEAAWVQGCAEVMIVIGIGGSNRGAMAAIEAMRRKRRSPTRIVWAGDSLSAARLRDVLEILRNSSVVLNVIAKDFNTVEPGIAFRVLRQALIEKYAADHAGRIIVTGSRGPGQLFDLALGQGYRFLDFPPSIGGRFSVLSAVGLFPMAVADIDIGQVVDGAKECEASVKGAEPLHNDAVRYAVMRNLLFSKGFTVESLVVFEPDLVPLARWWTQLFAETEGKNENAIFPTWFNYSEDLHAVGQYVQQGRRCIIETFLGMFHADPDFTIGESRDVLDGFGYLDGRRFDELNLAVYGAALEAHAKDGVPCFEMATRGIGEKELGTLFYFFMFSCYLSATLLGVNPFTQDGVEAYKGNLYRILGKSPGPGGH